MRYLLSRSGFVILVASRYLSKVKTKRERNDLNRLALSYYEQHTKIVPSGFEPKLRESKSPVLPLHHGTGPNSYLVLVTGISIGSGTVGQSGIGLKPGAPCSWQQHALITTALAISNNAFLIIRLIYPIVTSLPEEQSRAHLAAVAAVSGN